jgi:uncharacterized protein (TIGR03083 family)
MTGSSDPAAAPVPTLELTLELLPELLEALLALLRELDAEDWTRPTACGAWRVRDVAAHLLDGDLRRLSIARDGHRPTRPVPSDWAGLVAVLNALNAEWVAAADRLSPRVITDLLAVTGPQVVEHLRARTSDAPAVFPVSWAGEAADAHWLDAAREYTERWLHQQHIREAVGRPGMTGRRWLHPVLAAFVRALPRAYRDVPAAAGTAVAVEITGEAGGVWTLRREGAAWRLAAGAPAVSAPAPAARVTLSQDTAWRLFSKGVTPERADALVEREGDRSLGDPLLRTLAIMG